MATRQGPKVLYYFAGLMLLFILSGILIRHTLSAVLTSLVFAYLVNPLLKFLERRGLGRVSAIAAIYLLAGLSITALLFLIVPYVGQQVDTLIKMLPNYMQTLHQALDSLKLRLAPYYIGAEGEWLLTRLEEALASITGAVSGKGVEWIKGILFGMFNLVLAPILVFFLLCYKESFKDTLLRLTPRGERPFLRELGNKINRTLEQFILAMVLDGLAVGFLCFIALSLLNIDFPILNGLFAGFASIIPLAGAVLAVIPPALIGFAETGDMTIIPKVIIAYFLINIVIEGNVIKPLLMRGALKLNPLAVIFSLMAMGELMGFWGIVLAIPLAAVIKICAGEVREFFIERKEARG